MGKMVTLERSVIHTARSARIVILRIDPDTGVYRGGTCGDTFTANTKEELLSQLQERANREDGIICRPCYIVDPGHETPVVSECVVGYPQTEVRGGKSIAWSRVQWGHQSGGGYPVADRFRLPLRCVVRPFTAEGWEELVCAVDRVKRAKQQLAAAEAALGAMTSGNPATWDALPSNEGGGGA